MEDKEFQKAIQDFVQKLGSELEVSIWVDVSVPTVRRWAEGRNIPHPLMRKGIIQRIEEHELAEKV